MYRHKPGKSASLTSLHSFKLGRMSHSKLRQCTQSAGPRPVKQAWCRSIQEPGYWFVTPKNHTLSSYASQRPLPVTLPPLRLSPSQPKLSCGSTPKSTALKERRQSAILLPAVTVSLLLALLLALLDLRLWLGSWGGVGLKGGGVRTKCGGS